MIWQRVLVFGSILVLALMVVGCSEEGSGVTEDPDAKGTTPSKLDGDQPRGGQRDTTRDAVGSPER